MSNQAAKTTPSRVRYTIETLSPRTGVVYSSRMWARDLAGELAKDSQVVGQWTTPTALRLEAVWPLLDQVGGFEVF